MTTFEQAEREYLEPPDDGEETECRACSELYEYDEDDMGLCSDCECGMDYDSREGY